MTGKWTGRETLMTVGGVILLCTIVWFVSAKNQKQKDQLAQNHTQIVQSDNHTDSVQIRTDTSKKRSDVLDKKYDVVRTTVRVIHDTVFTPGHVYVDTTLAQIIQRADSMEVAHRAERAQQDSLVGSLHVGLSLRDARIKLLESRGTQRFSKGFQVGVGMCQSQTRAPCIYAGYGFQVRVP